MSRTGLAGALAATALFSSVGWAAAPTALQALPGRDMSVPSRDRQVIESNLLYSFYGTQAALQRHSDHKIMSLQVEIERLQGEIDEGHRRAKVAKAGAARQTQDVANKVRSLEDSRLQMQQAALAALAEKKDRAFAAELADLRNKFGSVLNSEEGKSAVALALAGDARGAAQLFDQLNAIRERAFAAKGMREAANVLLGRLPTREMIRRFEAVVAKDDTDFWDWVRLSELYVQAGDTARSVTSARKAIATARTNEDRWIATQTLVQIFTLALRDDDALAALEAYLALAKDEPVPRNSVATIEATLSLAELLVHRDPTAAQARAATAISAIDLLAQDVAPDQRREIPLLLGKAAKLFDEQQDPETAIRLLERAISFAEGPDGRGDPETLDVPQLLLQLAVIQMDARKIDAVGRTIERALALTAMLSLPSEDTAGQWVVRSLALGARGLWHKLSGRTDEALADFRASVEHLEQLNASMPGERGIVLLLAMETSSLAEAYELQGNEVEAKASQDASAKWASALAAADPGNELIGRFAYTWQARAWNIGRRPHFKIEAPENYERVPEGCRAPETANPMIAAMASDFERNLKPLPDLYDTFPLEAIEQATKIYRAQTLRDPSSRFPRYMLALTLLQQSVSPRASIDQSEEALRLAEDLVREDGVNLKFARLRMLTLIGLGNRFRSADANVSAIKHFADAQRVGVELAKRTDATQDIEKLASVVTVLWSMTDANAEPEKRNMLARHRLELRRHLRDRDSSDYSSLLELNWALEDYAEDKSTPREAALAATREQVALALAMAELQSGIRNRSSRLLEDLINISMNFKELNGFDDAIATLAKVRQIVDRESSEEPQFRVYAHIAELQASVFAAANKPADAAAAREEAMQLIRKTLGTPLNYSSKYVDHVLLLAMTLGDTSRRSEPRRVCRRLFGLSHAAIAAPLIMA